MFSREHPRKGVVFMALRWRAQALALQYPICRTLLVAQTRW
jgi:hypothetical protein